MTVIYLTNSETPEEASVMHRLRLYKELDDHFNCPLTGIISDSGFGKTSLIHGYMSYKGLSSLWCTFDDNDTPEDDIREVCDAVKSGDDPDAVVFDNCNAMADDPILSETVTDLIRLDPELKVFLLGTSLPKLPYAIMRAKEQYFELTHDDLALDRAETEEYFNDYLDMDMRDYELDFIEDRTHGWYTSNQLIYAYLNKCHLTNFDNLDINLLSSVTDINDYFSYNLYENQSHEMQDFMLKISPLTELDPEVIDLFLGIDDADCYLSELEKHRGFVYSAPGKMLRLHPLLRRFLYERYSQLNHDDYISAHQRLAEIYEKKHKYIKAFAHAVACNDYTKSIRLMAKISNRYNAPQLLNIIDGHLEETSPNLLFSNASIFLLRCIPEELSIQFVQPLTEAIKNDPDTLRQANLQHRLGVLYFHLGNINMACELLEKSLANASLLHNTEVMAFNYQLLADCHLTAGDIDQALCCVRNALYLSEQNDIPILQLHTLEEFARLQLFTGNNDTAEDYIMQAMELTSPDDYERFWLYAVLSSINIANGDAEQAVSNAEKAFKIVEGSICGWDIAYTSLSLAKAFANADRYDEAKEHLAVALDRSEHCQLIRYDVLSEMLKLETDNENIAIIKSEMAEIAKNNGYYWVNTATSSDVTDNSKKQKTPQISIQTFGTFNITCNGMPVKIKRSASIKLLYLLIINRGHFISKDYFINQLFPDSTASAGTNKFNVALSVLRKSIDTAAGLQSGEKSCIVREKDRYRLDPDLISIDAENFETTYMQLKKSNSSDLYKWRDLSVLYSEPFMQEYPYESILEGERDRLTSFQKDVSHRIAHIYAEQDDYINALNYYEQALEFDPHDEDLYYEAIELLLDSGAPAKAQLMADKMKLHIEKELGVPCSEQLQSLFDYYYHNQ